MNSPTGLRAINIWIGKEGLLGRRVQPGDDATGQRPQTRRATKKV